MYPQSLQLIVYQVNMNTLTTKLCTHKKLFENIAKYLLIFI